MTRTTLVFLALIATAESLHGQAATTTPAPTTDAEYQRAAALVRDGDGEQGRRIVDSLFVRARTGSPEHAEALYWRAALARDTRQAEADYRRLVVDHPLSRRVDRALLALAQLELARNDRERALAHLMRLEREHPQGQWRATGAFWTARIRFDMKDAARACASLDDARRLAPAGDVELRNQIEYHAGRCAGVDRPTTSAVDRRPAPVEPSTTASTADRRPAPVEPSTTSSTADRRPAPVEPQTAPTASSVVTGAGRRAPGDAVPSMAYAVQIAAYDTRTEAEALVRRLAARKVAARVTGSVKPFRVRTGSFASRNGANAALRELRARGIHGIVVGDTTAATP